MVTLQRASTDPEWAILDSGIFQTWDKADPVNPFKPLPMNKDYLRYILRWIHGNEAVAIAKSRDVMATLTISLYCLWDALFHGGREILCISDKAEKAEHNLGRIWKAYESMPAVVRRLMPAMSWKGTSGDPRIISIRPRKAIWPSQPHKGSRIEALAKGPDKIQEYHPSLVFFDQVDTTPDLRDVLAAIMPVMKENTKTILVGTPMAGAWEEICHDTDEHTEASRVPDDETPVYSDAGLVA